MSDRLQKRCPRCDTWLDIGRFIGPRAGNEYPYCVDCMKSYRKERNFILRGAPPKPDRCPICLTIFDGFTRASTPCMDHDPKTETFRGWVCYHCNLALGHFKDNIEAAHRMVKYLEEHQKRIQDPAMRLRAEGIDPVGERARKIVEAIMKRKDTK